MFGKLKGILGKDKSVKILAPLAGEVVPISKVNDPTFSDELVGKGVAIRPSGGKVVSPVNGTVSTMFDTGHAVSLTSDDGTEILIHIGLDTVKLKGENYIIHAHNGDKVSVGTLLMEFNKDAIAVAGYDTITPVVICNPEVYSDFEMHTGITVKEGDELMSLTKA